MAPKPSIQYLERIAGAITQQQITLCKQVAAIKMELRTALRELMEAKVELREAQTRLREIDEYLEEITDETSEMEHAPESETRADVLARKNEEYEELLAERGEELAMLAQLQHAHDLHMSVASHLRHLHAHLRRELTKCENKEKLLALIAMRSGAVKLVARRKL